MTRNGLEKIAGKTRVVGNWQPSYLDERTIGTEFYDKLREIFGEFIGSNLTVRSPAYHQGVQDWDAVLKWHVDGYSFNNRFYVLWSNIMPTEIRSKLLHIRLKVKDGDIVLLNNARSEHRVPARFLEVDRWFIRSQIRGLK